jgi:hypothetical protein
MNINTFSKANFSTNSSLPQAKLDSAATAGLKALATEDSDLGTVDGGNRGLSAYTLSPSGSHNLLAVAKDMYPGAKELRNYKHNPATTNLVAALTSEDEPHIHLFPQSKATGELGAVIVKLNTNYLTNANPELYQTAFPGASQDDSWEAMTAFFSKERHLDLGPGSAEHLWWT